MGYTIDYGHTGHPRCDKCGKRDLDSRDEAYHNCYKCQYDLCADCSAKDPNPNPNPTFSNPYYKYGEDNPILFLVWIVLLPIVLPQIVSVYIYDYAGDESSLQILIDWNIFLVALLVGSLLLGWMNNKLPQEELIACIGIAWAPGWVLYILAELFSLLGLFPMTKPTPSPLPSPTSVSRILLSSLEASDAASDSHYDLATFVSATCYVGPAIVVMISTLVVLLYMNCSEPDHFRLYHLVGYALGWNVNDTPVFTGVSTFFCFILVVPVCLWIAFVADISVIEYLEHFNNLNTLLISTVVYFALPGLIQLVILPTTNCILNSLSIFVYPKGYLKENKTSLERYSGNPTSYDALFDEKEINFWYILNIVNFFLENFTEAIICGILLYSGYTDLNLAIFAFPAIINASVRFLKIMVPCLTECLCFIMSEDEE